MIHKYKALALYSGGLDSLLSVLLVKRLGIDVVPIFFKTPFFTEHRAVETSKKNGFEIEVIDISNEHLKMMQNPVYGFGKNFNPCIDCHGLMFRIAGDLLDQYKADFLISGEVLSQRPMSQRRDALNAVSKLSGYKDLLVRPLSQQLLPDTKPIRENWINKSELLSISGRSRKAQLELAKELNVREFPNPGGGCKLTDKNFSARLKDLVEQQSLSLKDIELLKYGRHFRLDNKTKLIVSRNETENNLLLDLHSTYVILFNETIPGPIGLFCNETIDTNMFNIAVSIFAYYNTKASDSFSVSFGKDFPLENKLQSKKAEMKLVNKHFIMG